MLFLDEFPLFRTDIIEALRQPLESGDITVARTDESVVLPARGMPPAGGAPMDVSVVLESTDRRRSINASSVAHTELNEHIGRPVSLQTADGNS